MEVSSKVPAAYKNVPVAHYLAARFTYRPLEGWEELVREGRVSCNGRRCTLATHVTQGDTVGCDLPDFTPPRLNLDVGIIYEDAWLLGVNKPPGLRVHSRGKFVTANLVYYLRQQHQPPYPEVNLVNRLDADTSGVVVLARQREALPLLSRQFATGLVAKVYLALIAGVPAIPEGRIDLPIGEVASIPGVIRYGVRQDGGKTAVTHYRVRQAFGDYALVELRPQTGRTHQLRVHLAAIGHPILGDALYTLDDAAYLAWLRQDRPLSPALPLNRQALHCAETRFAHPATGQPVTFTAPLPDDMAQLMV